MTKILLIKKPVLIPGKSIEVYACGGQCRGKNSSLLPTTMNLQLTSKKKKLQPRKKQGNRYCVRFPYLL